MATRDVLRSAVRAALVAYGASASLPALSLGLGEIEMQSFLNEPLRAEVELLDTRALTVDDIRIRLAGNDDFNRLGIDRSFFLTGIQFDVEIDEASGRGVIRLTTQDAVLEPYLDLIIEARWPSGRLLREYTVLVDPPAFRQEVVTVSASERVDDPNPEKPALAPESRPEPAPRQTGDSVSLRESSLPPGEMPERQFSAETVDTPRPGNRYMVRRDETLWQIAAQGKPQGVSVQQAMLDIQRLNPEAFINGNINQIKAGYIIYLPTAGEMSSDDLARALEEVREQNKEWRSGRAAPGVTAAATLRVSADPIEVSSEAASDSAAEAGAPAASDAAAERVTGGDADTADPDAEAVPPGADTASAELAAQLNEMTERVDTLEQIVSVKDEQIATLEQALREARESAAAAPAPAPAPQVAPAPAPTPAAQPERSAAGGIPWMPVAGGALAVLLGVLVLVLRRRRADDDEELGTGAGDDSEDVFAGVSLEKDKLAAEPDDNGSGEASIEKAIAGSAQAQSAAKGEDVTKLLDPGGSRGYGERKHDDYIDEGAAGDALAEADIYIAYGRYLQAIELLEGAIADEPANSAYRLKLIELYVDMGEEQRGAEQLEELRAHGDADAIARAGELLGAGGAAAAATADRGSDSAPEPLGPIDYERTAIPEVDARAGSDDAAAGSLDFDTGHKLESEAADLTADDGADTVDEPQAASGVAQEPEETPTFDLELEELTATDDAADAADDLTAEPLEFDLLEIEEPGEGDAEVLDLGDVEDELDLTDALGGAGGDDESDDAEGGEELMIADDADQMATKLDLARAYIDMGDTEGARVILEEVAESGTHEQQQEANDLLTRVG